MSKKNNTKKIIDYNEKEKANDSDSEIEELCEEAEALGLNTTSKAKYIANPIMYVEYESDYDDSDSSCESFDEDERKEFRILCKEKDPQFPFSRLQYKGSKTKKAIPREIKFINPEDIISKRAISKELPENYQSTTSKPFLKNLQETGLESDSSLKIKDAVAASLFLNRPASVSTRENESLLRELKVELGDDIEITYKVSGKFWTPTFIKNKQKIGFQGAKSYYKKLKKYDKNNNKELAPKFKEFIKSNMGNIPYQELREEAKNSSTTKKLVKELKIEHPDQIHYMLFCDKDTISFNGIIDAYERIISKTLETYDRYPDTATTGYEFSKEIATDHPFVIASKLSRAIQVEVGKYMALLTYFPEPNFIVKVPEDSSTVPQSFIDKTRMNFESGVLLSNLIKANEGLLAIFSGDKPIITTIPDRCRYYKNIKNNLIEFSAEFILGCLPTKRDVKKFNSISQSKTNLQEFASSTRANKAFPLKGNYHLYKKCINNLLKSKTTKEKEKVKKELKEFIADEDHINFLMSASAAIVKLISEYLDEETAEPEFDEAVNFLKNNKINLIDISLDFIELISDGDILELFTKFGFCINEFIRLYNEDSNVITEILESSGVLAALKEDLVHLEHIIQLHDLAKDHNCMELYNFVTDDFTEFYERYDGIEEIIEQDILDESIECIINEDLSFQQVIKIYEIYKKHKSCDSLYDVLQQVIDAKREYGYENVVHSYAEDTRHLTFMSCDDITDYVYENSHDEGLVKFARDNNYDFDAGWIFGELNDTQNMHFSLYIGDNEAPEEDYDYYY